MRESRAKTLIVIHHTIYSVYLFTRKHEKKLTRKHEKKTFLHIGVLQVFFKSIKTQILISASHFVVTIPSRIFLAS